MISIGSRWNGPRFSAGVLSISIFSTYLDLRWPNVPTGILTFVDDKTRQPYKIILSFAEVNPKIQSGQCQEITTSILDYDKAEVICRPPKNSGRN